MKLPDELSEELSRLSRRIERLYGDTENQTRELRVAYLEASTLPREVLVAKLKQAIVIADRVASVAQRYAEAARRVDAMMVTERYLGHFRNAGAKGGKAAASVTHEVRGYAERLAKEREPDSGWRSAPQAADAIMSDLRSFARERNRNPSARKVAEWLREAGIKKGGRT